MIDCFLAAMIALATTQPFRTIQDQRPVVNLPRLESKPRIDGLLDEVAWEQAVVIEEFTQSSPMEGANPTERTRVRVGYDQDNLYVAFECFDSEPARVLARSRSRSGSVDDDDNVAIAIAPFGDGRNGYYFSMSAAGAKGDGLIEDNRRIRRDWNTVWFGESRRTDFGYVVEMAIPFRSISVREGVAWGLNLQRSIRRKNEIVRWQRARAAVPFADVNQAGKLTGIMGIDRGRGLEFRPFSVGTFDFTSNDITATGGFDLFWRMTPTTTAVLTVNTDFAEADVDSRVVNLTRFPLFFPERRAFFLQDAGVFNFGGIDFSPLPFYSRRIGIVDGQKKDILAGLKVTGREQGLSFGAMNVQMKHDREFGAKNLSVARVAANVMEESTVGFIGTWGDPESTGEAGLAGVDFNYRSSNLPGGRIVESNSYLMMTSTNGKDELDTDYALGPGSDLTTEDWRVYGSVKQVGEDFSPPLGFVQRPGVRTYNAGVRHRWRFDRRRPVARVEFENNASLTTDLGNRIESAYYEFFNLEFENHAGDVLLFKTSMNWENLDEGFDIRPGVRISPGSFDYLRGTARASSSSNRVISGYAQTSVGQFYDGHRQDYSAGLTLRLGDQLNTGGDFEFNDVQLPGGDFLVRIIRFRTTLFITPTLDWRNNVQYDSASKQVSWNSRVRWEMEPGQEMFVVLNQGFDATDGRFRSTTSQLTMKVGLTMRF